MNNQSSVCRLVLDFSDIMTNQVYTNVQQSLVEKGFTDAECSRFFETIKTTVNKNTRLLIDNIVKTYEE